MLLSVENLVTQFPVKHGVVRAVNGVSFSIDKGEILSVVGESGSGKSVTSLSVLRLLPPAGRVESGDIIYKGENLLKFSDKRMQQLRGNEISMIFQEPMTSLNPVYTVKTQLMESIRRHMNLSKSAAYARALEMLELVGIPSPARRMSSFPHEMSGGMRQRVMIAMALSCNPELLIADEPTTALDVTIQAQILDLLLRLRERIHMGILLITHDLGVVAEVADRVAVMYGGRIVEAADVKELFRRPLHPYTRGLIASIPRMDADVDRLPTIRGMVPDPLHMPEGCPFWTRCDVCREECRLTLPELADVGGGHCVRCVNI